MPRWLYSVAGIVLSVVSLCLQFQHHIDPYKQTIQAHFTNEVIGGHNAALKESAGVPFTIANRTLSLNKKPEHVIFYNIYFPDDVLRRYKGYISPTKIVEEQLQQLKESPLRNSTIYYTLIGKNFTEPICDGNCYLLKYYKTGFEEKTLNPLHNYCHHFPNDTVTYIHNKGSFSSNGGNTRIRRLATRAVSSSECLESVQSGTPPTCNTCGLTFNYGPHRHFSANMWTARCDYIRKLLPPNEYAVKRRELCQNYTFPLPYEGTKHCPLPNGTNPNVQSYGWGRYANERWPVSHPSVQPCSVFLGAYSECPFMTWCEWTERLRSERWLFRRFPGTAYNQLQFTLLEFEYLFGTKEDYCNRTFSKFRVDPCEIPIPEYDYENGLKMEFV